MTAKCDFLALFIMSVLFALAACSKPEPEATTSNEVNAQQEATSQVGANAQKIDPCGLLTSQEIESVQGEPVKDSQSSSKTGGGLIVSQCYFALPTPANSISLTLTQTGEGADARDPKEFWGANFHPEKEAEESREGAESNARKEEEEKKSPPQKIDALGDEAFWTATPVGGALYVLTGHSFVRISVGGAGDVASKLQKSKKLAQFALKRL